MNEEHSHNVGLTAQLSYLAHASSTQIAAWKNGVEDVLRYGPNWLQQRAAEPPILNQLALYLELEEHGFPPLLALQKQAGREALLAVLVLFNLEGGDRESAFEAWGALRSFRHSEVARKADWARYRRSRLVGKATNARRAAGKESVARALQEARKLAPHIDRRELASAVAKRLGMSTSQARRILKENGFLPRKN